MAAAPQTTHEPEPALERLTRLAARLLDVPVARVELPAGSIGSRRVVQRGAPVIVDDAGVHPEAPEGEGAYAGFPLFDRGVAVGAFCAIDTVPRSWTAAELDVIADLAALAQAQIDMRAASREARVTSAMLEQLVGLTDAARSAAGVDAMLRDVSRQAQHAFAADGAAIVLLAADGESRLRGGAGRLEQPPSPTIDGGGFAARVLAEDGVVAMPDLEEQGLGESAVARAGLRAAIGARLRVGSRTTGFIIVGAQEQRVWTPTEAQLLALTADRLAAALQREETHDADRAIADTLQRALLPPRLPDVPGLRLAARYEPAEHRIGGDWYDAFVLGDGRVGLAIGDVVGHGIAAAAGAVRLRHFLRGYVLRGDGPSAALGAINALVGEEPDAEFSSMLYLEIDPRTGAFAWAAAGHVPPARLRGHDVELLAPPGGSLLGAQHIDPWPAGEGVLEADERLVLYTDGLVERPGADVAALTQVLMAGAAGAPGAEALATALMLATPGPRRDDVAVVVAHRA